MPFCFRLQKVEIVSQYLGSIFKVKLSHGATRLTTQGRGKGIVDAARHIGEYSKGVDGQKLSCE